MFSITDNERLRDAYALLMFMQRDISASAEKEIRCEKLGRNRQDGDPGLQ